MIRKGKFYGTVKGGKLCLNHSQMAEQFIASFEDGCAIEVTITKQYASKTTNQLGYYFGVLLPIADNELGYGIDSTGHYELDVQFRSMFLTQFPGTDKERVRELSDLNVAEMGDYIDQCINQLGSLGIAIPPPDRQWRLAKKDVDNKSEV